MAKIIEIKWLPVARLQAVCSALSIHLSIDKSLNDICQKRKENQIVNLKMGAATFFTNLCHYDLRHPGGLVLWPFKQIVSFCRQKRL